MKHLNIDRSLGEMSLQVRVSRRGLLRRAVQIGVAAPIMGGLLAACGGDDDTSTSAATAASSPPSNSAAATTAASPAAGASTASSTTASSTTASSTAPATGATGGKLIVAQADPALGFDPASMSFSSRLTSRAIYDPLIELDEHGDFQPGLIEKWEHADPLTYLFHARQGVKFHDGTDFNAEAVKYHFDRHLGLTDPPITSLRKSELGPVEKVEVVDPTTVKITLSEPFAPFLSGYFDWTGFVMSPTATQKWGKDYAFHPVGTGPFKFVSYTKNQATVVERNPEYWRAGQPLLDEITFQSIATSSGQENSLRTGAVHIATSLPFQDIKQLRTMPDLVISEKQGYRWDAFMFNTQKEPWTNATLRRSFNWVIDREAIQNVVYFGLGQPGYDPFFPGTRFADPDYKPFTRDPDKAKDLIQQSGVPTPIEMTAKVSKDDEALQKVLQIMQANLDEVDIKLTIRLEDGATRLDDVKKGSFEGSFTWWGYRPDPDGYIYQKFDSKGSQHYYGFYTSAQADQMIEAARVEQDDAKRVTLYRDITKLLNEDAPYIFFHYGSDIKGLSPKVQGFVHFQDSMIRFQQISLKE